MGIPADVRWLSRAKAQARFQETRGGTSSVVAVVLGDATFSRVCESGVHLLGRRYEVEAFEEARPDAFCSRCCRWGHIAPHCSESPGVPFAQRTTPHTTTSVPLRDARPDEATGARM